MESRSAKSGDRLPRNWVVKARREAVGGFSCFAFDVVLMSHKSQIGTNFDFCDIWRKKQDFLASDSIENHPPTTTQSTWYTPYAAANVPTTTPKRTEKV